MFIPTLIMAVVSISLFVFGFTRGQNEHITGLKLGLKITAETLPLLLFAFLTAGMIQILLPKNIVSTWIGAESGFKGIIIGSFAGAITPGGPYVSMPIAAGLLHSGANIGTMVAFLTGWSLWAFARLPLELGILGWKLTLIRILSVLIFPPIAGLTANSLTKIFKL